MQRRDYIGLKSSPSQEYLHGLALPDQPEPVDHPKKLLKRVSLEPQFGHNNAENTAISPKHRRYT